MNRSSKSLSSDSEAISCTNHALKVTPKEQHSSFHSCKLSPDTPHLQSQNEQQVGQES